ncbi:MAG: response regulator transcription factor [Clostridiales bacterium]
MTNILICDDEKDIVTALQIYLNAEGYTIFTAGTGSQALEMIAQQSIQLVLMDIMMPGLDGIAATAKLRETSNIPVILLTAKSEDTDKVLGLNIGADDYITKPFNPVELIARVKSQLRRYIQLGGAAKGETILQIGGIELDDESKSVAIDGELINLTPLEYNILKFLMENAGKVFSSAQIYAKVWNNTAFGVDGTVAVHIRHLREKIEIDPANPRYLKVVWGQGYKFDKGV